MKKNKGASKVVLIFLILFFCLLCLIFTLKIALQQEEQENTNNVTSVTPKDEAPKTIKDVIEKYESEFISQDSNKIYAKFSKDLYDDNGKSNESFFNSLINDLIPFFEKEDFYLVDEEKNITIFVKYDTELEKHKIIYNDNEKFFKETNGKTYIEVETSEIIKPSVLFIGNDNLKRLTLNNMFFSSIKDYLGEGKDLEDGYILYPDDGIKLRLAPNKSVMNIIFTEEYEGNILTDVTNKMSLQQILELHPDNSSGSISEQYLGYRNGDLYYFFYKDETSVYGYSYNKNKVFEELLSNYIETKDLETFVDQISKKLLSYDTLEYNKDTQSARISFPTRGIDINIEENNPKGITLYSNYYFTDVTKSYVKNGTISYISEDLVGIYEKERRNSK